VTKASTRAPVNGFVITPALTSDDWIVPAARRVATTARPRSRPASSATSSRVVIGPDLLTARMSVSTIFIAAIAGSTEPGTRKRHPLAEGAFSGGRAGEERQRM
jgi:hypothetical protein